MQKFALLFIALLTLLFSSCIKEVKNLKLPEPLPKKVASCLISPEDTAINVYLSISNPLNQFFDYAKLKELKNSIVEINDGDQKIILPEMDNIYINNQIKFSVKASAFKIQPGMTYYLNINTPDGDVLNAATTVPLEADTTLSYILNKPSAKDNAGYHDLTIGLEFTDLSATGNFYKLGLDVTLISDNCPYKGSVYFNDDKDIQSDVNNNGKIIRVNSASIFTSCEISEKDSITLFLATLDVNYYKHAKSVNASRDENPFQEPVPVFSNINGGLGVFGSYRLSVKSETIHFKD